MAIEHSANDDVTKSTEKVAETSITDNQEVQNESESEP